MNIWMGLSWDFHDPHHQIDVLIRSNYYWNIVTTDTVVGNHGPVAISSKLGWLVSDPLDNYIHPFKSDSQW